MNTELTKRMEAHKAACANIGADPLVVATLSDAQIAAEVVANWAANRARPAAPTVALAPFTFKRQAG